MLTHMHTSKAAACLVFCGFFSASYVLADDATMPQDWIDRMGNAVQVTNYEGTVVRVRDGRVDTFKVVHTVTDGVVREKVVIQDGNGLEIIRNGNEVHCILPDRESVLVEEWNNQSTLFSMLPSSDIRFGSEYDVLIKDFERVAGRKAAKLAILPHDNYRYGYRIWLDTETGFDKVVLINTAWGLGENVVQGAVDPDEDLPGGKIRHEADVRKDRPGELAQPVSSADKHRAGSGEHL